MKKNFISILGIFVLASALGLWGCSSSTSGSGDGECSENSQCDSGEVCLDNACVLLCQSDFNCGDGMICTNGACEEGMRTGVPTITTINGEGNPTDELTDSRGQMTDNLLQTHLKITGSNLLGTSVYLESSSVDAILLSVESFTATELLAQVPTTLVEGYYTLRVQNSVGEAQTTVWVLQGEAGVDGVKGDKGDTPNVADIQAAVSAMTTLDVPTLGGRAADGYITTLNGGREIECENAALISSDSDIGITVDMASASGGKARKVDINQDLTDLSGKLWGIDNTTYGELLAVHSSAVTLRLKTTDDWSNNPGVFASFSCTAVRAGSDVVLGSIDLDTSIFAEDVWKELTLTCAFASTDEAQRIEVKDFVVGHRALSVDYLKITPVNSIGPCPVGWWSVAGGRLCLAPTLGTADLVHNAIGACKAMQARVCTHNDMQQACGAGYNPYGGVAPGWYGDHGWAVDIDLVTAGFQSGNTDDEYLTWNGTACANNNDGPAHASTEVHPYRCCW